MTIDRTINEAVTPPTWNINRVSSGEGVRENVFASVFQFETLIKNPIYNDLSEKLKNERNENA